jgi:hypothetical protein
MKKLQTSNRIIVRLVMIFVTALLLFSSGEIYGQALIKIKARKSLKNSQSGEKSDWQEYDTRLVSSLPGLENYPEPQHNAAGARVDKKETATGFFYTKKVNDRWWIVDPAGNLFINSGVVSVTSKSVLKNAEFIKKFKTRRDWFAETTKLIKNSGFNGTGNWSDADLLKTSADSLVYTRGFNFMAGYGKVRGGTFQQPGHLGYPSELIFVFDPDFEKFCDSEAKKAAQYKDEKLLLGYFSDNELPFPEDALDRYLSLSGTDAGYLTAIDWLKRTKNGDSLKQNITDVDRQGFLGYMSARYFAIVSAAIKKYDPNHMYLGCRFHGKTLKQKPVFESLGRYAAVVSINYYDVWTPKIENLHKWSDWSGLPILITEFYVKGDDSGMKNSSGAGWIVPTQKERGYFYQNFTIALLESKVCVGWHWFKYQDNDPDDAKSDPSNKDSNKGIVNKFYEPYMDMLIPMAELNKHLYSIVNYFDNQK